ncbi:MAG: site-specific integrase, partial [Methanobacterium paludis]|nr:site-specific integrase [Methanobacterium paludis]
GLEHDTIKNYLVALTEYCTLLNKTPSDLIKEAKEEKRTIIDEDERHINDHIDDYFAWLKTQNLLNSSIIFKLHQVLAFYNEYNVNPPSCPRLKRDKVIKKGEDVIKREDIIKVVNNLWNLKYKAMVTFLASSGLRSKDMRFLKIQDFVDATKEYHNEDDINKVIPELKGQTIVPCWAFDSKKTDQDTITFNTPECTEYILTYLNQRDYLDNEQYLFNSNKRGYYKPMAAGGVTDAFDRMNDANSFPKLGNGFRFFRAHKLRAFFGTTLINNEVPYSLYKKMMGQRFNAIDMPYVHPTRKACRKAYEKCIDALSTQKVEVKRYTSKEIEELVLKSNRNEERINEMEEMMNIMKKESEIENKKD